MADAERDTAAVEQAARRPLHDERLEVAGPQARMDDVGAADQEG